MILPSSEPQKAVKDENANNKYERYRLDDAEGRMCPYQHRACRNHHYTSLSALSGCNKAYGGRPYQRNSGPVNRFGPLKTRIVPILSITFSSQLDCLEAESWWLTALTNLEGLPDGTNLRWFRLVRVGLSVARLCRISR